MIGKLLDHRYQVIKVLATGGFGETYIAKDTKRPGSPVCVVKHLKPASSDSKVFDTARRLFHSEAETLEKLGNHDHIPRLLAYFDENQEFYLVQEFVEGHPLSDELHPNRRWSESQTIAMLQEVLGILKFVHGQGVIHRDIKPDNIIRRSSDGKLVLVDFGAVKQLRVSSGYSAHTQLFTVAGNHSATVAIGTPGYMPTEQGQGKPRPNSDLYSLGIIAIQALTGVAPMDLQEDTYTGEILWQHLVPVSNNFEAVLSKMVRYHFKDRYQSASEALQSLQLFAPASSAPVEYVNNSTSSQAIKYSSPESRQKTIAVAPLNPVARSPIAAAPKSTPKSSSGPDLLQLSILALLAGGAAAITPTVVKNVQNVVSNFVDNDATKSAQICLAVIKENSNIRSEPSNLSDSVIKTITKDSHFEVTGLRTKRGWVQLKLDPKTSGWAHSDVIKNNELWVDCLRDKGTAVKTEDDDDLITVRSVPKAKSKPDVKPSPSSSEDLLKKLQGTYVDDPKILEQARKKYESGDLPGAIALLKSVTSNAPAIQETTEMVAQWQKDWAKAEALFKDIDTAIGEGQWDKVLGYKDEPEKLPNIQYWRDKIDPLFKQAADNLVKQEPPKTNPQESNAER
ncbi:serine/threonine protein kinase [Scytonema hofmannii PCC 7110]|uniref:non-specific serine/threonine protein kinase n=1 Tax=Scytonema hofmannii PCC 7110 TaxID=128403 RepID=A0A139X5E8_9CYAN|nr:serine/threonine protein kinase [Scytonema hofmannii]KYC39905.1 serine/threonine protein kinase [Scytonema hofmannii PCC 7110]